MRSSPCALAVPPLVAIKEKRSQETAGFILTLTEVSACCMAESIHAVCGGLPGGGNTLAGVLRNSIQCLME